MREPHTNESLREAVRSAAIEELKALSLDLSRKATQLSIEIAGRTFPGDTEPLPPSPTAICGEIISTADIIRCRAPEAGLQ
jgi:hypothetical protein